MKPRFYQQEALDLTWQYLHSSNENGLIAMPTGTGKALVIALTIKFIMQSYPQSKVMMLTHVGKLVAQNLKTLDRVYEENTAGIHCADLNKKDMLNNVIFGTMQSVASTIKKKGNVFGKFNILLVDEAHLIGSKETAQYNFIINELRKSNPALIVLGYTATPFRLKEGSLLDGGIFKNLIYDITSLEKFNRLVELGFLSPLIPKRTELEFDLSNVRMVAGDYNNKDLDAIVDTHENTDNAVKEMINCGQDRSTWLTFANSINHAELIAEIANSYGIETQVVHSKKSSAHNDEVLEAFGNGWLRHVVNKDQLTTGTDIPRIDMLSVLRATESVGLWIQMLGRGTRPSVETGKQNCLVLDFAGNTKRLGQINNPYFKEKKKKSEPGAAPVKVCPHCYTYNHASIRECEFCGYEFPVSSLSDDQKLEKNPSSIDLIAKSKEEIIERHRVSNVYYERHEKRRRDGTLITPPCVKVTYKCSNVEFTEWVCFEHTGYSRDKAVLWWKERTDVKVPFTTAEALENVYSVKRPLFINVNSASKYSDIKSYEF